MEDEMASEISEERIEAILSDARAGMFAGMIDDRDALELAVQRGLVERSYEGAGGLMGMAKLRLSKAEGK